MFRNLLRAAMLLAFVFVLGLIVMPSVFVPAALAATAATAPPIAVNFSPIINVVVEILAAFLMLLLSWVVTLIADRLKLSKDSAIRAYLSSAVDNAIQYGKQKAEAAGAGATVKIDNQVVGHAVDYLVAHVPDALAHFGLTPDKVANLVKARAGWLTSDTPLAATVSAAL
jgi:hypothetical protein